MSECETGDQDEIVVDLGSGRKRETVSLRINEDLNRRLESEAERRGVGKSAVIREACQQLFSSPTNN